MLKHKYKQLKWTCLKSWTCQDKIIHSTWKTQNCEYKIQNTIF